MSKWLKAPVLSDWNLFNSQIGLVLRNKLIFFRRSQVEKRARVAFWNAIKVPSRLVQPLHYSKRARRVHHRDHRLVRVIRVMIQAVVAVAHHRVSDSKALHSKMTWKNRWLGKIAKIKQSYTLLAKISKNLKIQNPTHFSDESPQTHPDPPPCAE